MPDRTCSYDGCENKHCAKGLCHKHYKALRRATNGPCSVDGCDKGRVTLGLCNGHYERQRLGKPLDDLRPILPAGRRLADLTEIVASPPTKECVFVSWDDDLRRPLIHYEGQQRNAAAVVLTLAAGPRPGMQALHEPHTCTSEKCLNPGHLYWGTSRENSADQVVVGTDPVGVRNPAAKLTEPMVREILRSGATGAALAREYGVSEFAIYAVRNGKTWRHVRA